MWWLAGVGLVGAIITIIKRTTNDKTTRIYTAAEIADYEKLHYSGRYS
jgi:hypothetical protein